MNVHLNCEGGPVTGMLTRMNLSRPGMNLSKPGMNQSIEAGEKHNNHVMIWHQWFVEFPIKSASNWHWLYGDTCSPSLHTSLLDTAHMLPN